LPIGRRHRQPQSDDAGAGSAIFLHVDTGSPTERCASIPESDLIPVLDWLSPEADPVILIGTDAEIRWF
jgi:L,D-peptidoglycan transpeptidase YkuD (ErfK/YbiS/YcfS/YnhG family)